MTDVAGERQAAIETMIALRQARDMSKPGSKEYILLDEQYREAEAAIHKLGRNT